MEASIVASVDELAAWLSCALGHGGPMEVGLRRCLPDHVATVARYAWSGPHAGPFDVPRFAGDLVARSCLDRRRLARGVRHASHYVIWAAPPGWPFEPSMVGLFLEASPYSAGR